MATSQKGFTIIDQVVNDLQQDQSKTKKKANTVTTAIGSVATFVSAGLVALVENGTSLPNWFPFLVVFVGMVATTYGVSKTKNGVTDSLAEKLHDEIARRIDENHFHDDLYTEAFPNLSGAESVETLSDPDELLSFAKQITRLTL